MSFSPLVSVIIPTYNQSRLLEETVNSVLAQDYPHLEVIVIDDGSTDDTIAVLQRLESQTQGKVRFIQKKNGGTAAARNSGWRAARGELIALLDHDDLWMPHKLSTQVPLFEDPKVGLVHAGLEFFQIRDGKKVVTSTHFSGENVTYLQTLGYVLLGVQTLVFRKSVLEEIGGFDEKLLGTDDWDICIRVTRDYKTIGQNQILASVRLHAEQQSGNPYKMHEQSMAVINKHRQREIHSPQALAKLSYSVRRQKENLYMHFSVEAKNAWKKNQKLQAAKLLIEGFRALPIAAPRAFTRATRQVAKRVLKLKG